MFAGVKLEAVQNQGVGLVFVAACAVPFPGFALAVGLKAGERDFVRPAVVFGVAFDIVCGNAEIQAHIARKYLHYHGGGQPVVFCNDVVIADIQALAVLQREINIYRPVGVLVTVAAQCIRESEFIGHVRAVRSVYPRRYVPGIVYFAAGHEVHVSSDRVGGISDAAR